MYIRPSAKSIRELWGSTHSESVYDDHRPRPCKHKASALLSRSPAALTGQGYPCRCYGLRSKARLEDRAQDMGDTGHAIPHPTIVAHLPTCTPTTGQSNPL